MLPGHRGSVHITPFCEMKDVMCSSLYHPVRCVAYTAFADSIGGRRSKAVAATNQKAFSLSPDQPHLEDEQSQVYGAAMPRLSCHGNFLGLRAIVTKDFVNRGAGCRGYRQMATRKSFGVRKVKMAGNCHSMFPH